MKKVFSTHILYLAALAVKAFDGLLELIGSMVILIIDPSKWSGYLGFIFRKELIEDPNDLVANFLINNVGQLGASIQVSGFLYLLSHGLIKIFLVVSLLKKKHWAYPVSEIVLSLFVIYQTYLFAHSGSIIILFLNAVDILLMVLIWIEYKKIKKQVKGSYLLILGVIILSFLSAIFLYLNSTRQNEISPVPSVNPTPSPTPTPTPSPSPNIEEPGKEEPSVAPGKVDFDVKDIEGQLVKHLFNIELVPSPKAAAFSPDGKEIWATLLLNKKRGVGVFDASNGRKIKDIDLEGGGGVEIVFSKDGTKAYVSQMETAKVFELDVKTKEVLRSFDTQSAWTKELWLSKDNALLYASNWCGDDVSEIDVEQGELVCRIKTVDTPRGIYVTPDNSYLYVAGFADGEIQKIDLKTGQKEILLDSGGAMRHIAADEEEGILYFSDMAKASIWKLDLETDEVEKFVSTDHNPNTIVLSPDNKILFVSCRGINASADNYYIPGPEWGSVLLFDTETGKMLDAIIGGNQATALAVSPDGKSLVFSDFLDNRLEVFEIPDYEVLKQGGGGIANFYKQYLRK